MKISVLTAVLVSGLLVAQAGNARNPLSKPLAMTKSSFKTEVSASKKHLFQIATDKITNAGYKMPWDARESLRHLIFDGVDQMYSEGLFDETHMAAAETYVNQFVAVMLDDAQKVGLSGSMDMANYNTARRMMCPKTFFCK